MREFSRAVGVIPLELNRSYVRPAHPRVRAPRGASKDQCAQNPQCRREHEPPSRHWKMNSRRSSMEPLPRSLVSECRYHWRQSL